MVNSLFCKAYYLSSGFRLKIWIRERIPMTPTLPTEVNGGKVYIDEVNYHSLGPLAFKRQQFSCFVY